jgi:hypothetical protein
MHTYHRYIWFGTKTCFFGRKFLRNSGLRHAKATVQRSVLNSDCRWDDSDVQLEKFWTCLTSYLSSYLNSFHRCHWQVVSHAFLLLACVGNLACYIILEYFTSFYIIKNHALRVSFFGEIWAVFEPVFEPLFSGRGSQGRNRLLGLVLLGGPHEVRPHHGPSRCRCLFGSGTKHGTSWTLLNTTSVLSWIYHGFIWIIIYTETLGWNWWKTQSKHLYKINLANGLAAEQEQEAMHDERTFTGQPLVTATEDGRKREMKVVHLDNMDFWVHRSLYQSQRSIWLFLKVWIYNSV